MGWYQVVKTINGRRYLYLQMTYRSGGKVKTKNKYLGPANGTATSFGSGAPADLPTAPTKIKKIREKPPKLTKPAGGLKIDPIIRFKDLSPDEQKRYLRNSKRRIREDSQRADREYEATLPEEERNFIQSERERDRRQREEELEAKKREPTKGSRWFSSLWKR